jgi:putative copper resistance protein D
MVAPLPVDWHTIVTRWDLGPFPSAAGGVLILIAIWYFSAMAKLGARDRRWPRRRAACFVTGLVAVEVALGSSVAVLAESSFPAHIVQHLLLMVVAPPLLALGAPMTLLLQTSGRTTKRRLLAGLHSGPFAVISHPVVVWFLYYGSMFAFFLSPALGFAMDHMALMDAINLGFLAGATLFWWPMVGLDPIPRWRMGFGLRFLNLLIGIPFESFLGIALLMEAKPVAAMYTLSGTHAGGGVLWAATELATAVALIPMFSQWYRADTRQGARLDARADRREEAAALAGVRAPAAARVTPPSDPSIRSGWAATFAMMRRDDPEQGGG